MSSLSSYIIRNAALGRISLISRFYMPLSGRIPEAKRLNEGRRMLDEIFARFIGKDDVEDSEKAA
jgi:hypothetical protein